MTVADYPDEQDPLGLNDDKPEWTDPTTCPECGMRSGELRIEFHLFDEHGWFLIERNFESETLVAPRSPDSGEQTVLTDDTLSEKERNEDENGN